MKSKQKAKIILLVLGIAFALLIVSNYNFGDDSLNNNGSVEIQDEINLKSPKRSATYTESFIHIDGSIPNNWTWTAGNYSWCYYRNGYYIIENVTIDADGIGSGILVEYSSIPFIIRNCTVYNSGSGTYDAGIKFNNVEYGRLIDNNCSFNNMRGICLFNECNNNTISENTVNDNSVSGIFINTNCNENNITKNNLNDNSGYGIYINTDCDNNNISENIITYNMGGIYIVDDCIYNIISENLFKNNIGIGLWMDGSGVVLNSIYRNSFVGNTLHAHQGVIASQNYWYESSSLIGNHWDDHTSPDSDHDGIVDTPYLGIDGDCDDDYPLAESPFHVGGKIHIDDSGINAPNWIRTKELNRWCKGSGTFSDPYIIEGLEIDGKGTGSCIFINNSKNNYFTIKNCNATNSESGSYKAGIKLENTNNGTIINNNCSYNNANGICLYNQCINNTISGNTFNNNTNYGILLRERCDNNTILGNIANNNTESGIRLLTECINNTISGNTANLNTGNGIIIRDRSNNNTILGNTVNANTRGIHLRNYCDNNIISGNTVNDNNDFGIRIYDNCANNTISGNNINNNKCGIFAFNNSKNVFIGNLLRDNKDYGINIDDIDSQNNLIFYNLLEGTLGWHAQDNGMNNHWNYSGIGNYWDNYTSPDSNNDGIIDKPYTWINGSANSMDNKPVLNYNPVFFNPPDDFNYINETIGHSINWTVVFNSKSSLTYTILRGKTPIETDNLDLYVTRIGISVDGLDIGTYNFTIEVEDGHGGIYSDTVWLTVILESPSSPSIPIGNGDDDDDSDGKKAEAIPGYNLYLMIGIICIILAILIKRQLKFKQ